MTVDELRAAIAEVRARDMDEEARPCLALTVYRRREPIRRTVRVLPGVMGELLSTAPGVVGGVRVVARVFCDDLERYLERLK